ncbi:MAG: hypothetical protein ACR2H2_09245 [Solirubrobacteraceae bacterium]
MELIGALSNPETGALLAGIIDALDTLGSAVAMHNVVTVPRRSAQGEILRAIKLALADHPLGLPTVEVRRLVEARLGRRLPSSTVKGTLAQNGAFERMQRGCYRLRTDPNQD